MPSNNAICLTFKSIILEVPTSALSVTPAGAKYTNSIGNVAKLCTDVLTTVLKKAQLNSVVVSSRYILVVKPLVLLFDCRNVTVPRQIDPPVEVDTVWLVAAPV